jgi:hypothetical protein
VQEVELEVDAGPEVNIMQELEVDCGQGMGGIRLQTLLPLPELPTTSTIAFNHL